MWTCRRHTQRIATAGAVFAGAAGVSCTSVTTPHIVVAKVTIAPSSATLRAGTQVVLQATMYDAQGRAVTGQAVAWASKDSSIASVSPDGVVTGRTPGQTLIAAGAEGQSGIAEVDVDAAVTPPPAPPPPSSPPPPSTPPPSPPPPDEPGKPHKPHKPHKPPNKPEDSVIATFGGTDLPDQSDALSGVGTPFRGTALRGAL
jgi:Big-like domain-containing protein